VDGCHESYGDDCDIGKLDAFWSDLLEVEVPQCPNTGKLVDKKLPPADLQ